MITFRKPTLEDAQLYFDWANDQVVRENSYNQNVIDYADHVTWFQKKLNSTICFFYLFMNEENIPVGQVRIDRLEDEVIIGISIDKNFRGKSLGAEMLIQASNSYLHAFPDAIITAYIKEINLPSVKIFRKAGFEGEEKVNREGSSSYRLTKHTA